MCADLPPKINPGTNIDSLLIIKHYSVYAASINPL